MNIPVFFIIFKENTPAFPFLQAKPAIIQKIETHLDSFLSLTVYAVLVKHLIYIILFPAYALYFCFRVISNLLKIKPLLFKKIENKK